MLITISETIDTIWTWQLYILKAPLTWKVRIPRSPPHSQDHVHQASTIELASVAKLQLSLLKIESVKIAAVADVGLGTAMLGFGRRWAHGIGFMEFNSSDRVRIPDGPHNRSFLGRDCS